MGLPSGNYCACPNSESAKTQTSFCRPGHLIAVCTISNAGLRHNHRIARVCSMLLIEWIEWIVVWIKSMSGALSLNDGFFVIE
jgi:hypothetical protein